MKPRYRIPGAVEFNGRPRNGYKVVSTFSGCGGSCLGWRMAGYEVVWASEFVPAAQDTYRANHDSHLDTRDIRVVRPEEILAAVGMRRGELDVFDGSPPCSSFSRAGSGSDGWGKVKTYSDTKQRTDDLFDEYVRLVDGLLPRVGVAENVPALAHGKASGYFREIVQKIADLGYVVRASVLDAQWLGVPQSRKRLFIQGVREDLETQPAFPKPLPYRYSVEDACPWVVPSPDYSEHPGAPNQAERAAASISKYAIGDAWDKLRPGEQSEKYFQLVKVHPKKPCPTIVQTAGVLGAAGVTHPFEKRKWTISEVVRLSGFPDEFKLTGTYRQQWERLARSVPPPVMEALGRAIERGVLRRADGR